MTEKILCHSCGGSIDKNIDKCPYCGELNYHGAEKQYMKHLSDVKDDLSDLQNESSNEIKDELANLGRTLKRSLIIIFSIIGVFGAIFGINMAVSRAAMKMAFEDNSSISSPYKGQAMWLADNEENLNQMYDKGLFDEILEFSDDLSGTELNAFRHWAHYDFITYYGYLKNYREYTEKENLNNYDLAYMLYDVLELEMVPKHSYIRLTRKESEILEEYSGEVADFYQKYLQLDDKGKEEIINKLTDNGENNYISQSECINVVEELFK